MRFSTHQAVSFTIATLTTVSVARAQPTVPGCTVTTYAILDSPMRLTVDPSGYLFVGNGAGNGYIADLADRSGRVSRGARRIGDNEAIRQVLMIITEVWMPRRFFSQADAQ